MKKTTSLVVALMIGLIAVFTVSSQTVGTVPGTVAEQATSTPNPSTIVQDTQGENHEYDGNEGDAAGTEELSSVENGNESPELHKAADSLSGTSKDIENDQEDESKTIDSDTIQLEE